MQCQEMHLVEIRRAWTIYKMEDIAGIWTQNCTSAIGDGKEGETKTQAVVL